jgi:CubicO group peptidase (beta-lactamase class C family)
VRLRADAAAAVPALALAAAAAAGPLVGPAAAQQPGDTAADRPADDRFAGVRAHVERLVAEESLPSLAVGVARDGEILWQAGFGWADREGRRPADAHTMYSLASISKPITATAVLRLAGQDRIDLDAPVNEYLGLGKLRAGAGDPARATVRRVLSHTAGLPLHYQFFYDGDGYGPPPQEETLDRYGILVYPPGEVYQYANLGYGLLDHLVARVSGRSYADYLRSEVFVPLGMHRTAVDTGSGPHRFAAVRYDRASQAPLPDYDFDHRGASAVYASVHDMLRFGMFHLGDLEPGGTEEAAGDASDEADGDVLSADARRAMRRRATPDRPDGSGEGYGLGWIVDPDHHGARVVSHSGGMPGVRTVLRLFPEEGLVVTALTNTSHDAVFEVADRLAAAVLPAFARRLEEDRAEEEGSDEEEEDGRDGFRPPRDLVGGWSGRLVTWEGTVPARLVVQADGDVHLELENQLVALVDGVEYEEGFLTGRAALRVPTRDARRRHHRLLLRLKRDGGALRGWAAARTTERPTHFALSSYLELRRDAATE